MLDRGELSKCLENMELLGRKFRPGAVPGEDPEGPGADNYESGGSMDEGTKQELHDRIFAAFDEDGDGKIAWKEFLKGAVQGIADEKTGLVIMPPLTWEPLECRVAAEKAAELFAEVGPINRPINQASKQRVRDGGREREKEMGWMHGVNGAEKEIDASGMQ